MRPDQTVGVDLGDRFSRYCVLNSDGEVLEEGRVRTNQEALRRHWEKEPRQRMVMETGTHSPWVSRLLQELGHEVIVANARKLRAITENESKNDRQDAEMLARLGYCHPRLLAPVQHRSVERQRDLNLLRARDSLVRARTEKRLNPVFGASTFEQIIPNRFRNQHMRKKHWEIVQ